MLAKSGREFQCFICSFSNFSAHMSRNADYNLVDLPVSNNVRNPLHGVFIRRERLKRVRQQAQLI